jgi:predicted dehydrogenase
MTRQVKLAVIGAGDRGADTYGQYVLDNDSEAQVVAVAEPKRVRREKFARRHGLASENCFTSWKDLLAEDKLADGLIIATLDDLHYKPVLAAMEQGYDILLEKPIALKLEENIEILQKSRQEDAVVLVAHVLRYTNFFQRLKELLVQGMIGELNYINYVENIGYYHFAHSYVRGNWRTDEQAAPIIMAKSCHDLDLLYWLTDSEVVKLSSEGSLNYFTAQNQPTGAADRCLDCRYQTTCVYSAPKIYLTQCDWPTSVITEDTSKAGIRQALREGPYGRCVYTCDNNVPDTQTVEMKLVDGIKVQFCLTAFSNEITRKINFHGSLGEIRGDFEAGKIEIDRFGEEKEVEVVATGGGHGGGDAGLMDHFLSLCSGKESEKEYTTSLVESMESHFLAFAIEEARGQERKVDYKQWKEKYGIS